MKLALHKRSPFTQLSYLGILLQTTNIAIGLCAKNASRVLNLLSLSESRILLKIRLPGGQSRRLRQLLR